MPVYKTKTKELNGSNFHEVRKRAFGFYQSIKRKSKRKPYVRSAYFKKDKVFLEIFWSHTFEKNFWDQIRRMKFFPCAIELISQSYFDPVSKENPNKPSEILHRFTGLSSQNSLFHVQIKEEKRNGKKWLISVFPAK